MASLLLCRMFLFSMPPVSQIYSEENMKITLDKVRSLC